MIQFLNKCNGYSAIRNEFSPVVLGVFDVSVREARIIFEHAFRGGEIKENCFLGYRYDTDDIVLARITSKATSDEFMKQPVAWCLDALHDCAQADHYYEFEKVW